MAEGLKLAPLLTEIKVDIETFQSQMDKAASVGVAEAEKISNQLSTVTKVGDKLSSAGSALTKGLTVPLASAGIAAGKMAVDYETNFAKVSTLLDSNVVDYGKYKDEILDASSESKVAVGEFSEAVYGSISAGVDQTKAIGFTTEAMKLAKGGFTDGAKAVDVLTTAINGYGMEADDASKISDMLITTQNLGKTTVDELASSMGAVIPVASSVNFGMDELSASYAQLTKNGIATSESGTYLKSMLSELGKSGSITDGVLRELTGKGFAQLKEEGVSTSEILGMLDKHAQDNGKSLKDMFGSVEAGSAALVLAKDDGSEYNEMLEAMQGSAGATQEAFEKMDATPAERMKGALNELKNEGIKLGEAFVPVVEKVADKLGDMAEAFGNLSDEQKENVLKWGAVLMAAGPVLKVVGGGISTFTKVSSAIGGATKALGVAGAGSSATGLVGGLGALSTVALPVAGIVAGVGAAVYAVHEHSELMNSTVLKSRDEMSALEKVMADAAGMTTYTTDELEELGLKHKDFGENISPEFQQAVEDSTQDVQDFSTYLHEISFDGVLDEGESEEFNGRVEGMCNGAIETINGKKDEVQQSLKELFSQDGVMTESETAVTEAMGRIYQVNIDEITKLKEEIYGIKEKAVEEGRGLNDREIELIKEKTAEIKRLELEALGGTQEEIEYAKNEFSARVKNMDLQSASELLQEKAKQRDEEIIQIQAGYDTQISMLESNLNNMNSHERDYAEQEIAKLKQGKAIKIQEQRDLYDQYVGIVQNGNAKCMDEINKYTGEVMTKEDRMHQEMLTKMTERYVGLAGITESGCYTIYDKVTGMNANVAVNYDETSGEIIGIYDATSNLTGGYCEKMGKDAEDMADKQEGAYRNIGVALGTHVDNNNNVIDSNGNVVGSLEGVTTAADGTRTGIIDLNGTPIQVQVNDQDTIDALYNIDTYADSVSNKERVIRFTTMHDSIFTDPLWPVETPNFSARYNGLDYVPYDGYAARLHKGERVLTADENKAYNQPQSYSGPESVVAVLQIDGKEFARTQIDLIDKELAKKQARKRGR